MWIMVYTSIFPLAQEFQALCPISEAQNTIESPSLLYHIWYLLFHPAILSAIVVAFYFNWMVLTIFSVLRASQFCVFVLYSEHVKECTYQFSQIFFWQVHGKRFVYKFVCDLKQLLGYSASELNRLVEECARKSLSVGQHFSTTWWWIAVCGWTLYVYLGMCIFLN